MTNLPNKKKRIPNIQRQRWLVLMIPAFAGLFLLFISISTLNVAHATPESATAPLKNETAILPQVQSNQGPSRFAEHFESTTIRHTSSAAFGDYDGDGDLDLAIGNGFFGVNISDPVNQLYANDGKGKFTEFDIGLAADNTQDLGWGDWDGDGDLDLAMANGGQSNKVYENRSGQLLLDPDAGLGWTANISTSSTSLAWGDWDGDGDLDLAIGNNATPNLIYRSSGGSLEVTPTVEIDNKLHTRDIAWADWDNDGDLDLAIANYDGVDQVYENISDTLTLDPENGLGWQSPATADLRVDTKRCSKFQFRGDSVDPDFASRTRSLDWGDWDSDGDLDLAAGGGNDGSSCGAFLYVYENISGTLQIGEGFGWKMAEDTSSFKPASISWGDWDGDGDLDLVTGNNAGDGQGIENRVYENVGGELRLDPGRGFGWQSTIEPSLNAETTYAVALGDADGDGDLDLAVGNGGRENGGQTNLVLINTASVVALDPNPWQSTEWRKSTSTAWGDWDGDGDLDLAVGNEGQPNQVYENEDGRLMFDPQNGLGWESTVVTDDMTSSVAWGDWNGDGNLDLAVGNMGQQDFVYENVGETLSLTLNGEFGWQTEHISYTQSVAWGDWDRDGDLDLAAGHCNPNDLEALPEAAIIYENDGYSLQENQQLKLGWRSPEGLCARSVGWGDWDNDGDLDLALGARVYENVAGNLFLDEREGFGWKGNIEANSVAWGDMDGDGDLDLAVGTSGQNRVYENIGGYLHISPLSNRGWQSYAYDIKETTDVAWADIDGDEDLDLSVSNAAKLSFEPNQIFENTGDTLSRNAVWRSSDPRYQVDGVLVTSHALAWGDVDNDGDLDLAVANACVSRSCDSESRPNQVYENNLQGVTTTTGSNVMLSIDEPYESASANFYASPEVLASSTISLPFLLRDPREETVGRIEVQFSLDGGDNWEPAQPLTGTQTTNFDSSAAGTSHVFLWDTFGSDFFGQSDNVVVRMVAYPTPPAGTDVLSGTYRYIDGVAGNFQRPFVTATSFPFRVQSTQIKVKNDQGQDVEGAYVFRVPAGQVSGGELMPTRENPLRTDDLGLLAGGGELKAGDQLMALLPVDVSKEISFTNKVRYFHTSAEPTDSGLDLFTFEEPGIIELQVSEKNPLLLFDIDMSLEWDVRNDPSFQAELVEGVKRASELLYDVTNGQAALGQVRIFQAKEYWPDADVVVLASNSFRPYAPIGGVVQKPLSETVRVGLTGTKVISNAYVNSQIRMGTVWDPFGESSTDLGPDWWQAMAHELAHYLFFLPDDYLGFKDEDSLGKINCQGSFMTSTYDPEYSEFLTEDGWTGICQSSLAQRTTGRPDWKTIQTFYPMLEAPKATMEGPGNLPLEVTSVFFVDPQEDRQSLPVRNFEVRDDKTEPERLRLPDAQAYLFQTQGTNDPSDDILVRLGTPTGGGDRIKVRGAFPGDRLCLFDRSGSQAYAGCDDNLRNSDVSVNLSAVNSHWQPQIEVHPVTSRTMQVTVTQAVTDSSSLNVQIYPAQYWSTPGFSGLSPTATMNTSGDVHTQTLTLRLPAYEVSVRVWVKGDSGRESIDQLRLNPPWESVDAGPSSSFGGGPSSSFGGGPSSSFGGGPSSSFGGGPSSSFGGGPSSSFGGGPSSSFGGGPSSSFGGGPSSSFGGGPSSSFGGGPSSSFGGGPSSSFGGGPSSSFGGGAQSLTFNAPILSADAQVVIYSKDGLFEDNGIETLQILDRIPEIDTHPWLVPVGQSYAVHLNPDVDDERIITLTYLQRDVPDGYEHALDIYFLPKGTSNWQQLDTKRYVENLVVANLEDVDGTYAVMSSVTMPTLLPGWNTFSYPLPDSRPVTRTLASISGTYSTVYQGDLGIQPQDILATNVTHFEFGNVYWIWIDGNKAVIPYLAPPKRSPDGIVPGS